MVNLPTEMKVAKLNKDQLLALFEYMKRNGILSPSEEDLAYVIWQVESHKNLEEGHKITQEIMSIKAQEDHAGWTKAQKEWERNHKEWERINEFYKQFVEHPRNTKAQVK